MHMQSKSLKTHVGARPHLNAEDDEDEESPAANTVRKSRHVGLQTGLSSCKLIRAV